MKIFAVDRKSPILLGIDTLEKQELVIDYKYKTVWSHKLNRYLPRVILPSKHIGINLCPEEGNDWEE